MLRIERTGDSCSLSYSLDGGATFGKVRTEQFDGGLPETLCLGLAVSSGSNSDSATAVFGNVTINGETVAFTVDPREVKPLIYTPSSYIVEFDFDGKKELAVLREAQFHPVREEILHLDFYRIAAGKPVSIAIPVRLTGNAEGVKVGGKLTLSARKLTVSALVENLPDEIVVDVTNLGVGKTIFVGDLKFENLKFVTPATAAVCAVRVTRASRGADAAAAAK